VADLRAHRGYRKRNAEGEHGEAGRERRPEHGDLPLPRRPRRMPRVASLVRPAPKQVREETPARHRALGDRFGHMRVGWTRTDPGPDPFQAVRVRLYLVRGGVQRLAHEFTEFAPRFLRAVWTAAESHNNSCSRAARRAAIPRAVWLLTAPRLIPIVSAISASDRSA